MPSPTQLSLKFWRDRGYVAEVVEKYNSFMKFRRDYINFIDILAFKGNEIVGIQACVRGHVDVRYAKARRQQHYAAWLAGRDRRFVVQGWKRMGPRGKKKQWVVLEIEGKARKHPRLRRFPGI